MILRLKMKPAFSFCSILLALFLTVSSASAYNNPGLSINIKRIDSNGKITALKPEKNVSWVMTPNLCFQLELSDPTLTGTPDQWKFSKESDAMAAVKGKNIQTCLKNKLSSFTVNTPDTAIHYLSEVTTPNPQLALSPNCPFETVTSKLTGDFIGVGLECKMPTPDVVKIRAHFGTYTEHSLQIYYDRRRYTTQEISLSAYNSNPVILQVGDEKNHVYGLITLKMPKSDKAPPSPTPSPSPAAVAQVSPTPTPIPRVTDPTAPYYIPFEFAVGGSQQTSDAVFPSDTSYDQSRKKTFTELRIFRRAKLWLPFKPDFLKDVMYDVHARADYASEQNIEGWAGILKPVHLFSGLNTLIGVDVEYATSLNTPYGIKKFVGAAVDLQIETLDRRFGTRLNLSYAGSASLKFDGFLFYTPPWKAVRGIFFGVDYGYLSFPFASTNAIYDFKQTKIGVDIGYRFGTR